MPVILVNTNTKHTMKKFIKTSIVTAALLLAVLSITSAQTFSGLLTLSGTNTAPILLHFATQTSVASMPIQSQTLLVTNISTNEQITVFYAASSNGVPLVSLTTNFTAANGYTVFPTNWQYNIPGSTYYPTVSPWGTIQISSNGVTGPNYTNGVGLQ